MGYIMSYIHPVLISDDQDTYTITIELKENSFILGVPYVTDKISILLNNIIITWQMAVLTQNKNSSSSFSGEVTAKENERLFLSLPYENGWNVYIDK